MQLYQNKKGCEVIEDINGKILPSVTVFAESIEYLKGHFRKKIQAHGDVFTINEDEIRWVLTVPAIWDDFAKNVMRQVAIKAGIPDDNLILALEPEAASIYCQHLYTRRDQKQFDVTKEGTKFMVLDLGGGTADIAVQEKLQDGKLREIRRATGGPFGGSAVNDAFIKLLGNIVGSDVLGKFKLLHMYDFIDLLGSFELEKRFVASKSNTSNKFNIRVPVSLLEMIEIEKKTTLKELIGNHSAFRNKVRLIGDKLSIDENIIRDMFVGVMNEICKHVSAVLDTQEGNEVSLIQMVGGFSESQCVQEIIREKFQSKTRHVLVPQEAGIAVLKGAVIFGHSPNCICSRIIRYTYGNAVKALFQDGVHDERKRWNDGQKVWCQNVFKPFMKAGTSVEIGHSFVQRKPTSHYETARMKIYVTDNDDIMYVTDEGCRELCNVLLNEVLPSDVNLRQTVKQTIVFGGTDLKIRIQNENTRQSHRMSLKMDVEKEEKEEEEFQQTRL